MLIQRDVIRYGEDPATAADYRVVWAHGGEVVLFDLKAPDTRLIRRSRDEVVGELNDGTACIVTEHAYDHHPNPARLTEAQKARRDKLMGLIGPMLDRAPDVFDDRVRGHLIAEVERRQLACTDKDEKKRLASAKTLHQAFDRFWRRGMSVNALTPSFEKCGRGPRTPGETKLGAPVTEGMLPGVNVTDAVKQIFEKGLQRYYVSKRNARRKVSLKAAYDMMAADFFIDRAVDPVTGKETYPAKPEWQATGYPTFRQFRFWYDKRDDLLGIRRKREGASRYDKDLRGIVGTAVAGLMGAGSRFEIDSTPLDIGCVSEIDRTVPVGRPTFYQVTDVLTKMICGIYVGFENASWMAAGLAVRNVVEDKVAFCERYGVSITSDEWPCEGVVPARFMADRGEWEGYDASAFVSKSTVTVELAAPYRGDQKGSTEKKFDQFHRLLRTQLDGMIEKKVQERGDRDYRRDAVLNLREVTACVIEVAIFLNNSNKLVDYPRTREMIADRVRAVPVELWRWCRERGMDELSRASVSQIELAMLPVAKATVTPEGYRFRKLLYKPADREQWSVFDRALQNGVTQVDVSYDPLWTTNIWLHASRIDGPPVVLELTDRSIAFAGISFQEQDALRKDDNVDTARRRPEYHGGLARAIDAMRKTNQAANEDRPAPLSPAQLQGSKANRKLEAETDRKRRERASRPAAAAAALRPLPEALESPAKDTSVSDRSNRQSRFLS
ncbi:MAG: hypothetical protein A4S12_00630 [Proteobacteria bacterium SG_bin5]|nr:MAG: hypothetical protein A4S12_00630 [Proteobacteria bacterium SG_bin5]